MNHQQAVVTDEVDEKELAELENRIRVAISYLLREKPFFGFFLIDMVRRRRDDIPAPYGTFLYEGRMQLLYRPALAKKYNFEETQAILEHEVLHLVNNHMARMGERRDVVAIQIEVDGQVQSAPILLWNAAADYAINCYIKGLPKGCLNAKRDGFPENESADTYYELLKKKVQQCPVHGDGQESGDGQSKGGQDKSEKDKGGKGQKLGQGQPGQGGGQKQGESGQDEGEDQAEAGHEHGPSDKKCTCGVPNVQHVEWEESHEAGYNQSVFEETIRAKVQQAADYAKQTDKWGSMPAGIQEMIENFLKPVVRWERELRAFYGNLVVKGTEGTRNRPNRRYEWDAPGRRPSYAGKVAIMIDTSGSVGPKTLQRFVSEAKAASEYLEVVIVECDAGIERVYPFQGKLPGKSVQGRGGTDFTQFLDIICEQKYPDKFEAKWKGLLAGIRGWVCLTDGYLGAVTRPMPKIPGVLCLTNTHGEAFAAWTAQKLKTIVLPKGEE